MNNKLVISVLLAVVACLSLAVVAYFATGSGNIGPKSPATNSATGTSATGWTSETFPKNAYDEAVASGDPVKCAALEKGESDKCAAELFTDTARKAFSPATCGKISNRLLRADCAKKVDEYVAAYAPDVKSCASVRNEALKNECSDRVNLALASQGDSRACDALVNQAFKASCADSFLIHQVDAGKSPASACRRLTNKSLSEPCMKMGEAAFLRNGSTGP